jgi:heavy metal sensor kinase
MSLTARLSAFFLGALAFVLAGFALTLYLLARTYLYRQVDERLTASLDTLEAAAELDPDGLDWEPTEHHVTLGQDSAEDQVRWLVREADGKVVDHSSNLRPEALAGGWPDVTEEPTHQPTSLPGQPWRFLQRRLQAGTVEAAPASHETARKYRTLVLTGAMSRAPVAATLRTLGLTLAGLSTAIWLSAALLGRWLCRRALVPVTRMAASARAMRAADREGRLPSPGTRDELEDLGLAFNDLLARLHEALERQRRFTGDASHQLRTPLTAVLGQIEVALRRERSSEDYRQVLTRVHGRAQHLQQIVEMLLFLARADVEARLPDLEVVDLSAWLGDYLQRWSEHPRAADLRREGFGDAGLKVRVQPPLLGQLLDNLLDNACKYSPPGYPITLRLGREGDRLFCVVEDAGQGIPTEDLPHVFEPFYRSPKARQQGRAGIGLGLAIVQRIAAAFGGTVTVRSSPGKGSQFTLYLPEAKCSVPMAAR